MFFELQRELTCLVVLISCILLLGILFCWCFSAINVTHILMFSFPATTLTGFHFGVTALVGLVSKSTGLSASKHVPLWELLWFSIVANMSITGMNLSLMLNSVGFYQV